jgi:hypothetical protein
MTHSLFVDIDSLSAPGVLEHRPGGAIVDGSVGTVSSTTSSVLSRLRSATAAGTLVVAMAVGSTLAAQPSPPARDATEADHAHALQDLRGAAGMWAYRLYVAVRDLAPEHAQPCLVSVDDDQETATVELALPRANVGVVLARADQDAGWYMVRREADDTLVRDSGPLHRFVPHAVVEHALG